MNQSSRRDFLKYSTLTVVGTAALGRLLAPTNAFAQDATKKKLPLLAESDPQAKALGYHHDASKVDTKKWAKKGGADGKTQHCGNCMLFNSGKVTSDKEGPCSLFPGKAVANAGWCNSWVKNPAAK